MSGEMIIYQKHLRGKMIGKMIIYVWKMIIYQKHFSWKMNGEMLLGLENAFGSGKCFRGLENVWKMFGKSYSMMSEKSRVE